MVVFLLMGCVLIEFCRWGRGGRVGERYAEEVVVLREEKLLTLVTRLQTRRDRDSSEQDFKNSRGRSK
jgi:hypothetical protein